MKKTLAALAVLGAFAGTSLAADVTLYGIIDTGFNWTQTKNDVTGVKTDKFQMASGQNSGPRFGFKGTEDLGNGLVVGFNLENSFNSDDGGLAKGSRLFHREAILFVRGGFGEVALGRTGSLDAGTGSYNLIGTKATAFGLGWDQVGGEDDVFSEGTRYDNTATYKSPTFAGVTLYAQASLKMSDYNDDGTAIKDDEGSSKANRYYGLGATYNAGNLGSGLVLSMRDWSRATIGSDGDDGYAATAYVNYNFGMIKPMLAAQWFDEGSKADGQKGYGVVAGFTAPVAGGLVKFSAGYRDAELSDDAIADSDCTNYMVGAGYEYPLSKRTIIYGAAGYWQKEVKVNGVATKDDKTSQAMVGLVHKF